MTRMNANNFYSRLFAFIRGQKTLVRGQKILALYKNSCLLGDRPTIDMLVGFGQLRQNRLVIKAFGNLELTRGRLRI